MSNTSKAFIVSIRTNKEEYNFSVSIHRRLTKWLLGQITQTIPEGKDSSHLITQELSYAKKTSIFRAGTEAAAFEIRLRLGLSLVVYQKETGKIINGYRFSNPEETDITGIYALMQKEIGLESFIKVKVDERLKAPTLVGK